MNENEVFEVLSSYKDAIDTLISEIDALKTENQALNEKIDSVNKTLFDEILEPARMALENNERETRFADFDEKYGEKLGAYDPTIQAISGNKDYSLAKNVFEDYDSQPEPKPDADEFVNASVAEVEKQIEAIKENLGLPANADVEVKQDGETGDTQIVSNGEVVAEEKDGEVKETTPEEEPAKEEPKADSDGQLELDGIEDKEEVDNADEVKQYEEELKKFLK